jgi:hypothetical protein
MRRLKGRRPSPAMTVAGAALIIALAGTAMAAPTALKSVLDKKEKKQVKNIANKQINKRAPGLSVANAQNAGNADTLDGKHASQLQTTSAYGERTADLPLDATFQDVVTASITATTGARIVATASLELDSSATARCLLRIAGGESFIYDEQSIPTETVMALTFARTVSTGTHAVEVECTELVGNVIADDASLSVVAVPE